MKLKYTNSSADAEFLIKSMGQSGIKLTVNAESGEEINLFATLTSQDLRTDYLAKYTKFKFYNLPPKPLTKSTIINIITFLRNNTDINAFIWSLLIVDLPDYLQDTLQHHTIFKESIND